MMETILGITDVAQIFTLNNKIFVQVDNDVRFFGNKNLSDTERLFEIVKKDLIKRKRVWRNLPLRSYKI